MTEHSRNTPPPSLDYHVAPVRRRRTIPPRTGFAVGVLAYVVVMVLGAALRLGHGYRWNLAANAIAATVKFPFLTFAPDTMIKALGVPIILLFAAANASLWGLAFALEAKLLADRDGTPS